MKLTSTDQPRVVALGGGRGLSSVVSALRDLADLTAVVSVADDGASSGVLRAELGVMPPGDFRKVLVASAATDPHSRGVAELFEQRFAAGALSGHAVGNLLLAGLFDSVRDPVEALRRAAEMVGARGVVLPMAERSLDLLAQVIGHDPAEPEVVSEIRGQAELVRTPGRILDLRIEPDVPACASAVAAIRAADVVVLGPGSWYTSVLPPLLIPEIAAVVSAAPAVVVVLNLESGPGETAGMSAADHLEALHRHVPSVRPTRILADHSVVLTEEATNDLERAAESLDGRVVVAPMASARNHGRHDADRLANAFRAILAELVPPGLGTSVVSTVNERMAATRWQ